MNMRDSCAARFLGNRAVVFTSVMLMKHRAKPEKRPRKATQDSETAHRVNRAHAARPVTAASAHIRSSG